MDEPRSHRQWTALALLLTAPFDIGDQFSELSLLDSAVNDQLTGLTVVALPAVPATLQGLRVYAQAALVDSSVYPLHPSDARFTEC